MTDMPEKKVETAAEIAARLAKALETVNEIIHDHDSDAEGEIPLTEIIAELPNVKKGLDITTVPENFIIGDFMELVNAIARNEYGDIRRGFVVTGIIADNNVGSFLKIVPNGGITVTVGNLALVESDKLLDIIRGRDLSKKASTAGGSAKAEET